MRSKIKVGISQGDINGISYEVIIKALTDSRLIESCTPILYGSPKVAAYHRKALNITNFSFNAINKAVSEVSAVAQENAASSQETSSAMQEVSASMQQVSSAATDLTELATQLQVQVGKFKIDESKLQAKSTKTVHQTPSYHHEKSETFTKKKITTQTTKKPSIGGNDLSSSGNTKDEPHFQGAYAEDQIADH